MMRVLITGMTSNYGGVESYVFELYKQLRNDIRFSFLVNTTDKIAFEDELISDGCEIVRLPSRRKDFLSHYQQYGSFFRNNSSKYDLIYCNLLSLTNIDDVKYASKYGLPIIVHSHNCDDDIKGLLNYRAKLHDLHRKMMEKLYITRLACSEEAGRWMFGSSKFETINNFIDTKKYRFSEVKREQIRNNLGISESTTVFGTTGRLEPQKNSLFYVILYNEIHKSNPNTIFLHLGDGSLREEMNSLIQKYGLEDSYFLLGMKDNADEFYNAFDYFAFLSAYEGFGISLLESQCNGLVSFISNRIPQSARANDELLYEINLDDSVERSAETIMKVLSTKTINDRSKYSEELYRMGFDAEKSCSYVYSIMKERGRSSD